MNQNGEAEPGKLRNILDQRIGQMRKAQHENSEPNHDHHILNCLLSDPFF
jgi:hypothetical protein